MTSQTATPQPAPSADPRAFKSFAEFYPFYLSEHSNRTCRRLHFVGSTLSMPRQSRLSVEPTKCRRRQVRSLCSLR